MCMWEVVNIASVPPRRDILIYCGEQTWRGPPLAGWAALHLVFKQFKLERGAAMAVDIATLTQLEFGKDLEVSPKKTYVSLRRNKQFALIQPSTATRVDVGLNLKGHPVGDRLEAEVFPL